MRRFIKPALIAALILTAGIFVKGSITPPSIGGWLSAGSMSEARTSAASALLEDGRILITGGDNGSGPVASAEFFDTTGAFLTAPPMSMARKAHSATVLADGRILVAGGSTGAGATNSAEIFDPAADAWTAVAGGMIQARSNHTASLLADGRVLFAGGDNAGAPIAVLEIFDPAANSFSSVGVMSSPRMSFASAVLSDGRVMLIGGSNGSVPIASTKIFDPLNNSVAAGPALSAPRMSHSATTLLDGRVLVAGGTTVVSNPDGSTSNTDLASAEIYDPATGNFALSTSSLAAPRRDHAAFLLPNNNSVLIVGGISSSNEITTAEMFVPSTGTFIATGSPAAARQHATGTALKQDGILLLAGGSNSTGPLSSAELYGFATVKTDRADYAPGTIVTITGSGWQPGETVTLTLVESPLVDTHPVLTAVADSTGKILNTDFSPDIHDLNIRFYLTAVGQVSGRQAQNTFTDNTSLKNLAVGAQSPVSLAPGGTATFVVTVGFNGNGSGPTACTVALSVSGLPPGTALNSFAPSTLTGLSTGTLNSTLTIDTTTAASAASSTFTVTATGQAGTNCAGDTQTGNGTLTLVAPKIGTMTVGPQTGALSFGTPGSATYLITVNRNGATGTAFSAALGLITSLPTGASASFSPSTVNFAGSDISKTSTLTITDSATTPAGSTVFTVQATNPSVPGDSSTANGSLTVDKATPTITWANPADINYGTALSGTQLNATASVPGTFTYNPAIGIVLAAGNNQNLHVDFAPTDTTTYNNASKDVKINVKQKSLTATLTADDKVYDGAATEPNAKLHCALPAGSAVGTDDVSCTASSGTFNSSQVSAANTVTATVALTGTTAGNYSLTSASASASAHITAAPLTATVTADAKEYDGTTTATLHCSLPTGVFSGDVVTCSATGAFASKNVATPQSVNITNIALSGAQAGNYSLSTTTGTTTASITALHITGSFTASNKIYDGNTSATVLSRSLTGAISGDAVSLTGGTATFGDKTVANGKTVTLTGASLSGADAGNYILDSVATTAADITAAPLTVTAVGINKQYDGSASAAVTLSDNRITGDVFTDSYTSASFADKNVANGKTVSVSGIAISGTDAGNYTLSNTTASTTANITPAPLTVTATGVNKQYDATTAATVTLVDNHLGTDVVTDSYATATFGDKSVANGKTVSVTGISISGTDAGNYTLSNTTATTTANITARNLTVTATGVNRVYDGTTTATVTLSDNRITGDVFADSYTSASFADASAGTNKTVTVMGISISGTDASNYTFNTTATTTATINPKSVIPAITADGKDYDGTVAATIHCTVSVVLAADISNVNCSGTGSFADANAGAGKTVTSSDLALSGSASGNYVLSTTTATATATINKVNQTITWADPIGITYGTALSATQLNAMVEGVSGGSAPGALTYTPAPGALLNAGAGQALQVDAAATINYNSVTKIVHINVSKATPIVNWSNPSDIVYGTVLSSTQLNATFTWMVGASTVPVAGVATYTPPASTLLGAGPGQLLSVSFAPTDTTNYNAASATVHINVQKATPIVTWSNPADIAYGTPLSGTQLNATFTWVVNATPVAVPGTPTYTPAAGTLLNPGSNQVLTVNFSPADTANYNNAGPKTVAINVGYGMCSASVGAGGIILPPINSDGTSVYNRKGGSTIPVKFRVCNASGASISNPAVVFSSSVGGSITMLSAVRGTITDVNEDALTSVPDVAFRWDASGQQWIFNMATSNLTAGSTDAFKINLAYAPASITFVVGVK